MKTYSFSKLATRLIRMIYDFSNKLLNRAESKKNERKIMKIMISLKIDFT